VIELDNVELGINTFDLRFFKSINTYCSIDHNSNLININFILNTSLDPDFKILLSKELESLNEHDLGLNSLSVGSHSLKTISQKSKNKDYSRSNSFNNPEDENFVDDIKHILLSPKMPKVKLKIRSSYKLEGIEIVTQSENIIFDTNNQPLNNNERNIQNNQITKNNKLRIENFNEHKC